MNILKHKIDKASRGFTLIELLVVIAIIGVLASIVLISLRTAQIKSRDARRIGDLRQLRIALESYNTANAHYPIYNTEWAESYPSPDGNAGWIALGTMLAPYMPHMPSDPLNTGSESWVTGNYTYSYYSTDGTTYDLITQLENQSDDNRCEVKCWKFHFFPEDYPWCGCGGPLDYSLYIYADH